jgi:septal ring factor EnvC (AmiA/AmiB activator)
MAKQSELAASLKALTDQTAKIFTEVQGVKQKVTDLEAQLGNTENVSDELQAAFDALKAQVQIVDDLIPDAPATLPAEPPAS